MRAELTCDTTFYVSTSGSTGNDGLSDSSPWPLQYAIDTLTSCYILNNCKGIIQLADGTYSGPFGFKSWIGSYNYDFQNMEIRGNSSNVDAVVLTGSGLTIGSVDSVTPWVLRDLTIQVPTGGMGLLGDRYSKIFLAGNIKFTGNNITHGIVMQYDSFLEILAGAHVTVAFTGTGVDFATALFGSTFVTQSAQGITPAPTITFASGVSFANGAFLTAIDLSICDVQSASWSGSFTGPKFYRRNGLVKHSNNIPGSSAGVSDGWQ